MNRSLQLYSLHWHSLRCNSLHRLALIPLIATLASCSTTTYDNAAGTPTVYRDVQDASPAGGIGLEARDLVGITDDMMRDLLTSGLLTDRDVAPRVIIDAEYLSNQSTARFNKNILTDTLRTELIRNSLGRILFVTREYSGMVEAERALKRDGVVDSGTIRLTEATAGADFRLVGRISSLDAVNTSSSVQDRTYFFTFELVDLELNVAVYAFGPYEFSKFGQDDVIYR
jgi:penicillin-binding protein activator